MLLMFTFAVFRFSEKGHVLMLVKSLKYQSTSVFSHLEFNILR